MCRTSERLRELALKLSHANGGFSKLTITQDSFISDRAELTLLRAAEPLSQEFGPILALLGKIIEASPCDSDAIASLYGEIENYADDMARYYGRMAEDRMEFGDAL